MSTARAYLRPARNRPNLDIMLNSTATKILIDKNKKIKGVKFVYKNKTYTVYAKKEVILSAGAINTPQLLLLSGIGPKQVLDKVNIKQVHNLPGVGQNLKNHVSFFMYYDLKLKKYIYDLNWANALEYVLYGDGPLSSPGMSQVTSRLNSKLVGPNSAKPDVQMFFEGYKARCAASGAVGALQDPKQPNAPRRLTVSPVALDVKSTGFITLNSSNPFDAPLMHANYLTAPQDVQTLIQAIRYWQEIVNTSVIREKYDMVLDRSVYGDCEKQYRYY